MKIINQLTLRYLKENKKRTILTILCITVSVIMISCVGIAFYSGKQFYKDYTEKTTGDYHYAFIANNNEFFKIIENDNEIEEYYFSRTESMYGDKSLESKSFFNLKSGDQTYFKKENYQDNLQKGRLPARTGEIAISEYYLKLNHIQKTIGDKISFYNENNKKTYEFQIVGIINEYQSENYNKSSFSALSYVDLTDGDYYTIYIRDKEVSQHIFEHGNALDQKLKQITKEEGSYLRYNSSYLAIQDIFEENSSSIILMMYKMVAIILSIIIFISVFIIYQAFNLSTNDRIQYLGMLSSVGATPKQKKRSVYFEGLLLSIISIPLGILLSFIGLAITFFFISHLESIAYLNIQIRPQISYLYLLIVIILALLTIFISLFLPARKISKISVIDALKKNDEIKVKSKKLRIGFLSRKFFNISQQLALKNYKRQGRRSRVIVLSLVISMIAFVAMFSFGSHFLQQMDESNVYNKYDLQMYLGYDAQFIEETNQLLNQNEKVDDYYYLSTLDVKAKIDKSYLDIPISSLNSDNDYHIMLIGMSENKRKQLFANNKIPYNKNQVLAYNGEYIDYENDKQYSHRFQKMDNHFIKKMYINDDLYDNNGNVEKHKIKTLKPFDSIALINNDQYVKSYNINGQGNLYMIVPIEYITSIDLNVAHTIEYRIFSKQHQELMKDLKGLHYDPFDYAQSVLQNRQIFIIVQIFVYGFVFIMILFTMLNIINMMSASIDKRKKELGMMLSVGMSPRGISKMLFYESFIYGFKTFIYGLPICIGIEWLFFNQMGATDIVFHPSWIAYLISFIVIMVVMLVTFRVGLNKFRKQNIIETLKEDM